MLTKSGGDIPLLTVYTLSSREARPGAETMEEAAYRLASSGILSSLS